MKAKFTERLISAAGAVMMLFSAVGSTVSFPVFAEETAEAEAETELCRQSIELHPNGEESEQVITLEGMMPEGAEAEAVDVTDEYPGIAAYDITVTNGSTEYQPGEEFPIRVEITDPAISEAGCIELWHIRDDGESEQITDFKVTEGTLSFYATGFSVYQIVVPESSSSKVKVNSLSTLKSYADNNEGMYIQHNNSSMYLTNQSGTAGSLTGITATSDAGAAALYYFEYINDQQYYIYCMNNGTKNYLLQSNTGNLTFVSSPSEASQFYVTTAVDKFKIGSTSGKGWKASGSVVIGQTTNSGEIFNVWYGAVTSEIPLNNCTYGLMYYPGGTQGYAIMADEEDSIHSLVQLVTYVSNAVTPGVTLYVDQNSEITRWTFHRTAPNTYTLSADTENGTKYLKVSEDALVLTDSAADASEFKATFNPDNKMQLSCGGKYIAYSVSGSGDDAVSSFTLANSSTAATWLNLLDTTALSEEDYIKYSAHRISVSDAVNGKRYIVYTRLWNETEKRYNAYAVDFNGTLYPCYASSGKILWLGDGTCSLEWEFIEYVDAVTKEPNYYYELYNPYSEKYIAPQLGTDQVLSGSTIGVNMNGRRKGEYYSTVLAWDDAYYAYIGLKPDDETNPTRLVPCAESVAVPFYFAELEPLNLNDSLHTIETIDNNEHGITIKMQDFPNRSTMSNFMGEDDSNTLVKKQGLLSTNIGEDSYPKNRQNQSLATLFNNPTNVNHLFIKSVYESSGYFEFDSCQNFATLCKDDGTTNLKDLYTYTDNQGKEIPMRDFTVYRELGTADNSTWCTRMHGQFFPYDTIINKPISKYVNLYSSLTNQNGTTGALDDKDPRKGEKMYCVGTNSNSNSAPNYYNGMELEASFVQTASGLDAWGHDIIFEFTGDDDFWLYVDGELVIDLGGMHSALAGSVNFRTGDVIVDGKQETLIGLFRKNMNARGETDIEEKLSKIFRQNDDGQYIFTDYSSHTMRIFYMERGAGASNLHMRFNLASVTPGHVVVSKKTTGEGADSLDMDFLEYPFQIYYIIDKDGDGEISEEEQADEKRLDNSNPALYGVHYQNSNMPVTYMKIYRPPGEEFTFENVFFINPTKNAEISLPDNTILYRIVECAVDPSIYGEVLINGEPVPETITDTEGNTTTNKRVEIHGDLRSYSSDIANAEERPSISFENCVNSGVIRNLRFTKRLVDEYNREIKTDPSTFSFRLYLTSYSVDAKQIAEDKYRASMQDYLVLKDDYICRFNYNTKSFLKTSLKYTSTNLNRIKNIPEDGALAEEPLVTIDNTIFKTSEHGAISGIPSGYTVCVPGLPAGTVFMVSEDIKSGYGLDHYECEKGEKKDEHDVNMVIPSYNHVGSDRSDNIGKVISSYDAQMNIYNKKGYSLTVKKKWSDLDITTSHGHIYTAVYVDGQLLENSVKQIKSPAVSAYYFWSSLKPKADGTDRISLDDYEVREVTFDGTDFEVDSEGNVSKYGNVTPVAELTDLSVTRTADATPAGESQEAVYNYAVSYAPGTSDGSSRTDTIKNTRKGGIALRLFKWKSDQPLEGGIFTLYNSSGDAVGKFTSDSEGIIHMMYSFNLDEVYTLQQNAAPKGYIGLNKKLKFMLDSENVIHIYNNDGTVWAADDAWANAKPGDNAINAYVDVYNKTFNFIVEKLDSVNTDEKLDGAHFALYKQVNTPVSGLVKNQEPMAGFEDMVTKNGSIDVVGGKSDRVLEPGEKGSVYFLTELAAPFNYSTLSEDIVFRVSPLGIPSIISGPEGTLSETEDSYIFSLSVPNTKADPNIKLLTILKKVAGTFGNKAKEFTFTVSITNTDQTSFKWAKNSSTQSPDLPKTGGTFTMKDSDRIEIALPIHSTVTVTESESEYTAVFQLDANAPDAPGFSKTFTFEDNATLTVTNTLNGNISTGVSAGFAGPAAMIAVSGIPIGIVLYSRRRRRKAS